MNKFTVIVPVAGKGQRFKDKGHKTWKPLIRFDKKTMLEHALGCLPKELVREVIYVLPEWLSEHEHIMVKHVRPAGWNEVEFSSVTEPRQYGQATSVLYAMKKRELSWSSSVLVMNCDQLVHYESYLDQKLIDVLRGRTGGCIPVFSDPKTTTSDLEKWSYVYPKFNYTTRARCPSEYIDGVIEKPILVDGLAYPIVGWFAFSDAQGLIRAIENMVIRREKVNEEYYLGTVINEYMECSRSILMTRQMTWRTVKAVGIGTPEDLTVHWPGWEAENE